MRFGIGLIAFVLLAGCAASSKPEAPPAKEAGGPSSGWRELFDGQTLEGWVQRGGRAEYRVENGEIVGATRPGQPNSFLCTVREYGDFELDLEFKVDPALNSGIQVRSHARADGKTERVYGYQVEIDPGPRSWTGGVYEEAGRGWLADMSTNPDARAAFVQGEWNHFRIECAGPVIRTWINGVPAAELTDSLTARGFIALQVHGVGDRKDELTVRWRGIRIRETGPAAHGEG